MPWCDSCSAYNEPTESSENECPTCGGELADHSHAGADEDRTVGDSAPWHFWIVVVALIGYIGWRIVDFVMGFF